MANKDIRILQNGIPRSGNLWLHHMIQDCMTEAGIEHRQYIQGHPVSEALKEEDMGIRGIAEVDFLRISPVQTFFTILDTFKWPVEDMDAYLAETNYVTSHSPWNDVSEEVYGKFSHVVYIIRDPRDAALSLSRFMFNPYNRLHKPMNFESPEDHLKQRGAELLSGWLQHVRGHLIHRDRVNMHVVFYEQLTSQPEKELGALNEFLGLGLDEKALNRVIKKNQFSDLKKEQPNHLHKGGWGGWREDMGAGLAAWCAANCGQLMRRLGYPVTLEEAREWEMDDSRPRVPDDFPRSGQ